MCDIEATPFFSRQRVENSQHLLRVGLEPRNSLFPRESAKPLSILVERLSHYQQPCSVGCLAFARHLPARQIPLGHIYHMANHIPHLPIGAARLHIPVFWIINDLIEVRSLATHYIKHSLFRAKFHWIERHDSLPPCVICSPALFN